jgi:hypothetical protein
MFISLCGNLPLRLAKCCSVYSVQGWEVASSGSKDPELHCLAVEGHLQFSVVDT